MLQLIISGLPAGGMYALAALGIVLIYRTTGTLSFAQGAIATVTAYVFNWLWDDHGWPLLLAIAIALSVSLAIGLLLEAIMRVIGEGKVLAQVIATLGVSGLALYLSGELFGHETRFVPGFLPSGSFEVAGVVLTYDQLAIVGIAAGLAAGLGALLVRTKVGTAIRATSQNRLAANLAGLPVRRLQKLSWAAGALLAGVAGLLLAPLVFLDTVQLSLFFLVKPFAAAVVGGLSSLGIAFAAGLLIGVVESVLTRYTLIPGLTEIVPFAIIVASLVVRQRVASTTAPPLLDTPSVRPGSGRVRSGAIVLAVLAAAVPMLTTAQVTTLKVGVTFALLALSLVVLTGWVGQVSLAQAALFGCGGFIASNLANRFDLPFPLVLVLAPLLVVPFAVAVGLPALRFRGLLLAVVTLAFGSMAFYSLFQWREFTGGRDGNQLPRPDLLGLDLRTGDRYAYVMLVVAGIVFLAVRNLGRFRVADALFGVRDSEEGAASLGIDTTLNKLAAFAVSGAIAGIAGVLFAYDVGSVSFDQYSPFLSFTIFAVAVFAGIESLWGAALAGLLYAAPPELLEFLPFAVNPQLTSSLGVVLTLMLLPGGLVTLPARLRSMLRRERAPRLALGTSKAAS